MEQVKLRTAALTLRSAAALEALANAAELLLANPTERIRFRFTTTARVGLERPSPYPGRKKKAAIDLWTSLRSGQPLGGLKAEAEATISSIATAWSRPPNVPIQTWTALTDLVGPTGSGVLILVPIFEWATAAAAPTNLRAQILNRLRQEFGLASEREQQAGYFHLFYRVFTVLTVAGRKQLRRDLLLAELRNLSAPPDDSVSFQRIVELLTGQERALKSLSENIDSLGAQQLELLGPGSALANAADYLAADTRLNTAPPPSSTLMIDRTTTASEVLSRSEGARWISLVGTSGSGKTQLARDVVAGPAHWVRLDGSAEDEAPRGLETWLARSKSSGSLFESANPNY